MSTREDIGKLTATTESIGETLTKLGSVLEKIAAQGERVTTLETGQNILFTRVRDIELNSEREKVKVGFIMGGVSAIISGVTVFVSKHFGGQ